MGKQKVLMISVMKPLDEPRIFEKIGHSLSKMENVEVHSAGQKSSDSAPYEGPIVRHALYNFSFGSIKRLFAFLPAWKLMRQLKPEVVVVATHELLWITVLYKWMAGSSLIYDVQENYALNMRDSDRLLPLRNLLALYIQMKERICGRWIDLYWLAEKCYAQEMPRKKNKGVVIENKSRENRRTSTPTNFHLVYTGTIGKTYGTLEAIAMAKRLLQERKGTFTLAGFSPDIRYLEQVRKTLSGHENMHLIGGDYFVPHKELMAILAKGSAAIMSYQNRRSINNKIPTRFYECITLGTPMIIPSRPTWVSFCESANAAISIDFQSPDPKEIIRKLENTAFYENAELADYRWESNEYKLQASIANILTKSIL